jgi:hypothetical protein
MMVCLTIPLATALRNRIKNKQKFSLSIFYWVVFALGQFYLIFIGSRHEAFICGLTTILYISYPYQKMRDQWRIYGLVAAAWDQRDGGKNLQPYLYGDLATDKGVNSLKDGLLKN